MNDKEKIKEALRLLDELSMFCTPAEEYVTKGHPDELKDHDDYQMYLDQMSDIVSEAQIILDPEKFHGLKKH